MPCCLNPSSRARIALPPRPRRCRPTRVSSSTSAPAAAPNCVPRRAIAASSVPTAPYHALRSRPHGPAKRMRPRAAFKPGHEQRGRTVAGLVGKRSHECAGVAASPSSDRRRSYGAHVASRGDLDCRADLDGRRMYFELASLRPDTLPLHWPLLSRDDRAGSCPRGRRSPRRPVGMAGSRRAHSRRKWDHLVGHRAGVGKVLLKHNRTGPLRLVGHAPPRRTRNPSRKARLMPRASRSRPSPAPAARCRARIARPRRRPRGTRRPR